MLFELIVRVFIGIFKRGRRMYRENRYRKEIGASGADIEHQTMALEVLFAPSKTDFSKFFLFRISI